MTMGVGLKHLTAEQSAQLLEELLPLVLPDDAIQIVAQWAKNESIIDELVVELSGG